MASAMVELTSVNTVPHFGPTLGSPTKANSPYGLPIVDNCMTCKLHTGNFFCSLSQGSMKDLDRMKHSTSYPEGAIVFMEGQRARGVYIVCQGRAKLLSTNSDGRTLILKIAQPGEVLGLQSVITGRSHEVTAETLQPCQLAFISSEDILRFIQEHGDACLQAAQHISRDCQSAYDMVRSIGLCHSASAKLARFLLQWAEEGRAIDGTVRAKLTLTHEEIAQLVGSSRETVTRILGDFRKQRIAEISGSTLLVRNRVALAKVAAP